MGFRSRLKGRIKKIMGGDGGKNAATTMREALATLPTEPDAEGFYAVATADLIKAPATPSSATVTAWRCSGWTASCTPSTMPAPTKMAPSVRATSRAPS